MQREHCTDFPDIAQENSRANFEQKDKIVRNSSTRILRIVEDYPNRKPIYYLQSIAHNLSY